MRVLFGLIRDVFYHKNDEIFEIFSTTQEENKNKQTLLKEFLIILSFNQELKRRNSSRSSLSTY